MLKTLKKKSIKINFYLISYIMRKELDKIKLKLVLNSSYFFKIS